MRTVLLPRCAAAASFVLAVLGLSALPASGQSTQALAEDWRATSSFTGVMLDLDGNDNALVVGDTVLGDIVNTRKYDRTGVLLWSRTYDPPERVAASWISADSAGNAWVAAYHVTGSSYTPSGWVVLKYGPDGTLLSTDVIPGAYARTLRVETDANGHAYVTGRMWLTNAAGLTTLDVVTIKYGPDGSRQWARVFDNGGAADEPTSLALSADGGRIAVCGKSAQTFFALVYDADGILQWQNAQSSLYGANDLAFAPSGDLYVGAAKWTPETSNQMAILKFDGAGALLWTKAYADGDFVYRLAVDSQENVVAAGVDQSTTGMPYLNWVVLKVDENGSRQWSRLYDAHPNNDEMPAFLTLGASDHIYVTGQAGPGPSTGLLSILRMTTLRYAPDGRPEWANFTDSGRSVSVRVAADDAVYVLGQSVMTTIRYRQTGLPDLPPAAPSGLTGQGWYTGVRYQVRLAWTDVSSNEFGFWIERCTGSGCSDFSRIGQTLGENASSFADSNGVTSGATYSYRVRAFGFMGDSAPSNVALATTPAAPAVPTPPSNLSAVAISASQINLTWTDNSNDELQFKIERCTGAGCTNFAQVWGVGTNLTSYGDSGLAAGVLYRYRVRAWNTGGDSAFSNIAQASTLAPLPPAAPSGLQAFTISRTRIDLSWTNNTANQDGVSIERCQGSSCVNFVQVGEVGGAWTSFVNTGLRRGTTYSYRVRSFNTGGASAYSNRATATTRR